MIAGQINLLKERADAVAQLVCSLKAENASLKQNLFSAQSQINTLLNEITRLKTENRSLTFSAADNSPDSRIMTSFSERETHQPEKTENIKTVSNPDRLKSEYLTEFPDRIKSSLHSPNTEISDNIYCPNSAVSRPAESEPKLSDAVSDDKNSEFDPFFDAFSQFEDLPENSIPKDRKFENKYTISEEPSRTDFQNSPAQESEPENSQSYSQLDIFY